MVTALLLALLWGGSLQEDSGYELHLQDLVTVQEGLCVLVNCSFSYPWSRWAPAGELYAYWYREGDSLFLGAVATNNQRRAVKAETRGRFRLLGDPEANNCSLSIRDARRSDTGTYYFRVERGERVRYSYRDKTLNLQVTALTQKPDIHLPEPLQAGSPANLTCSLAESCEGGGPLLVAWVGDAVDSLDATTDPSSVLTLTPRPQDHGTNLTCQVTLQGPQVATERTIWLNVSYSPQNLTISVSENATAPEILLTTSSLLVVEGQALRLLCAADSNPVAELSWFRGPPALHTTPFSSTETLELPRVELGHGGEFTCHARNRLGSQHVSLSLSVHHPPRLLGPSCSWEDRGLHCNCSSRALPAPSLCWRLGEALLQGNHSNASLTVTSSAQGPWAHSALRLSGAPGSGLRLSCEARNVHGGARSSAVLLLPGGSVSMSGVVPGALGGAGVTALLFLCLGLLYLCIVRVRRKQAARKREGMDDEDPVMGTVAWGSRQRPWPDSAPDQAGDASPLGEPQEVPYTPSSEPQEVLYTPSSGEPQEVPYTPSSGEPQEVHYASLSFPGKKPREPGDQEAPSTTEYSEIRMNK
ncbi:sialic acid-binding Ig-like lectin 5 [Manis javanica]|uniref:sialic acid-binding Ig-like lectin 5 n=1 Tax=Manis javanica TaxID=9974 RepID=UPI003C6D0F23